MCQVREHDGLSLPADPLSDFFLGDLLPRLAADEDLVFGRTLDVDVFLLDNLQGSGVRCLPAPAMSPFSCGLSTLSVSLYGSKSDM